MRFSKLILLAALITGLFLAFILKQSLTFHLVSSVPKNGSKTNQYTWVEFKFNRSLAPQTETVNQLIIQPAVAGRFVVKDKSVIFTPISAYKTGVEYTVRLSGIKSSTGARLKDKAISFTTQYVAYKDLPADIKSRLVGQTDVNDSLTAPYSPAVIAIAGSNQLLSNGLTSDEFNNLQKAFYNYFQSTHQEIRAIQLSQIKKSPHDPESSSMVDSISFKASWKGSKTYASRVEYSNLNIIRLYLYDGQKLIFDSGNISG